MGWVVSIADMAIWKYLSLSAVLGAMLLPAKMIVQKPHALMVSLPQPCKANEHGETDVRSLVVDLHGDGSYWINNTPFERDALGRKMIEIMETRNDRFIWLKANADVPYERVIQTIDMFVAGTPDLYIALMTPASVRGEQHNCVHFNSFFIEAVPPVLVEPVFAAHRQ